MKGHGGQRTSGANRNGLASSTGHGSRTPQPLEALVPRLRHIRLKVWTSWGGDALVMLVLCALPFLFFWRFVTPDLSDRMTLARGDFVGQYYPLRFFVAQQLGQGTLPLWDPYIYSGQPALADIQSAAWYPPNLIEALLLGGDHFTMGALEIQVILHFSLAAAFTYLFVRRLMGSRFAGVVSSVAYTYGGYMTSFPIRQMTMLGVGVWLPLILFYLEGAFQQYDQSARTSNPRPETVKSTADEHGWARALFSPASIRAHRRFYTSLILAGVALGVSILGGHPQTSLYVGYCCMGYLLYRLWSLRGRGRWSHGLKDNLQLLLPFALVPIIGVGLAAAQWLPTAEFIRLSTRAELNYATVSWGLPIYELVSLIYPGYAGNSPQYLGILPMILVGAGLFLPRRWGGQGFWAAVAVVSLLLSFGGNTFLFSFFYKVAPGFASVRDQERVVFLFAFSMAVLAGYGVRELANRLEAGEQREPSLVHGTGRFAAAMLVLTALFLYGWARGQSAGGGDIYIGVMRHHLFTLLVLSGCIVWLIAWPQTPTQRLLWKAGAVVLIAFNLFTINWEFHANRVPTEGFFPETSVVRFLKEQAAGHLQPFRISSAGLLPGGNSAGTVYNLRDITGNSPLHLAAFEEFDTKMGEWRKWQLWNVLYVLDVRDLDGPGLRRVHEEGGLKVYEVTDPFPFAWVVHETEVATGDEAYNLLNMDVFDLHRAAVVSEPLPFELQPAEGSTAQVIETSSTRVTVQADLDAPGLLVLSEMDYPGWKAIVDGQPVPIVRTDAVLRGIPLPAGSHRVEMHYAPESLYWGVAISGLVLVAAAATLAWTWRCTAPI